MGHMQKLHGSHSAGNMILSDKKTISQETDTANSKSHIRWEKQTKLWNPSQDTQ
jgi:hypothetical protein